MADGHVGYVIPIGGVAACEDAVSVVGVGFDIACGNAAIQTDRTLDQLGGDERRIQCTLERIAERESTTGADPMILVRHRLGWLTTLCLALVSWSCAPATMSAQSASGCRPADTVKVPQHLAYLKRMVANNDSVAVEFQTAFQLQSANANKVALVTRASTCASAATALNAVRGTPGVVRQVWVYTLGSNFAVEDPTIPVPPMGAYPIYFFSSTWVSKPVLMY
jgi:hypothetical protein